MYIVTGNEIFIPGREFILLTCEVGAVWHLTPHKIRSSKDSFFGQMGTGRKCGV